MQPPTTVDTASPRYGFDPKIAFAATRAGADRRRQASAMAAHGRRAPRSVGIWSRGLATRLSLAVKG
jgi:hypothetical protein